ncbi:hypothetical protein Q3A80_20880 [Burkholderia sp. SR8]
MSASIRSPRFGAARRRKSTKLGDAEMIVLVVAVRRRDRDAVHLAAMKR